ncbi:MAG: alpha/beta-type small acid-soluble spore protein [Clostridia bacterium]|nr:alpha/beta-type small acid-soluble spore protein [Clostridia bacterium]
MGAGQKSNKILVQNARNAMDQFKYEVAREVGIANQIQGGYWGNLSSRDCGAVGGGMVRKMIQLAEQQLAGTTGGTTPNA